MKSEHKMIKTITAEEIFNQWCGNAITDQLPEPNKRFIDVDEIDKLIKGLYPTDNMIAKEIMYALKEVVARQ